MSSPPKSFSISSLAGLLTLAGYEISLDDSFHMEYAAGILLVTVRRPRCSAYITRHRVVSKTNQGITLELFDPQTLNLVERDAVVRSLIDRHLSTVSVARWLGVSVETIRNALRRIKARSKLLVSDAHPESDIHH